MVFFGLAYRWSGWILQTVPLRHSSQAISFYVFPTFFFNFVEIKMRFIEICPFSWEAVSERGFWSKLGETSSLGVKRTSKFSHCSDSCSEMFAIKGRLSLFVNYLNHASFHSNTKMSQHVKASIFVCLFPALEKESL